MASEVGELKALLLFALAQKGQQLAILHVGKKRSALLARPQELP